MPDYENRDTKLSAVQRAVRNAKKHRLGDMAYEGDADWEVLINEQGFLENHQVMDYEQALRTRDKFDSSSTTLTEAENTGAVAVAVGLKARAAGPIERIKFKEILKRRGGLQEYLECRLAVVPKTCFKFMYFTKLYSLPFKGLVALHNTGIRS